MLPIAKPFITVKIWRETKALIDMHAAQLGESYSHYRQDGIGRGYGNIATISAGTDARAKGKKVKIKITPCEYCNTSGIPDDLGRCRACGAPISTNLLLLDEVVNSIIFKSNAPMVKGGVLRPGFTLEHFLDFVKG
jgi:hypothetical protein